MDGVDRLDEAPRILALGRCGDQHRCDLVVRAAPGRNLDGVAMRKTLLFFGGALLTFIGLELLYEQYLEYRYPLKIEPVLRPDWKKLER